MKLFACSTNKGKLREFALAGGQEFEVVPLPGIRSVEPPDETGTTFDQNAVLKALYYSRLSPELVFADDSGLEVDALDKQPGVYSARFAGPGATDEANNRLLLDRLRPHADRRARFVCSIALARSGKLLHIARGAVEGQILDQPKGQNGFGYDPLFFYPPGNCGFAELTDEEKFAVSHRGQALRALFDWLRAIK